MMRTCTWTHDVHFIALAGSKRILLAERSVRLQTYRLLWVYLTVSGLARPPSLPPSKYDSSSIPASWQAAVGTLAAQCTPLVVIGGGQLPPEQLEAGMARSVGQLDKVGSPASLKGCCVCSTSQTAVHEASWQEWSATQ